jgi:hypothetical protein
MRTLRVCNVFDRVVGPSRARTDRREGVGPRPEVLDPTDEMADSAPILGVADFARNPAVLSRTGEPPDRILGREESSRIRKVQTHGHGAGRSISPQGYTPLRSVDLETVRRGFQEPCHQSWLAAAWLEDSTDRNRPVPLLEGTYMKNLEFNTESEVLRTPGASTAKRGDLFV